MDLEEEKTKIAVTFLAASLSAKRIQDILIRSDPAMVFSRAKQLIGELALPEAASQWLREPDWKKVEETVSWCRVQGVRLMWRGEVGYPLCLEHLSDPPSWLYLWGEGALEGAALAVVGTRQPSLYGRQVTARLVGELTRAGLIIVSGLARGLDAEAHRATLENGGRTWAILGSGFQRLYPPENVGLARRVLSSGLLVSEYPPPIEPAPWHFPARNRLIAALSLGVLVVEAGERSGTLLTADFALDLGIEVFAVPGPITSPQSVGCHRLLKQGAKLVEKAEDVLEELRLELLSIAPQIPQPALSAEEEQLQQLLAAAPLSLEEIVSRCPWPASKTLALLSMLEVKGLVRALPGSNYAIL
ncbi:MAG: DNA-processing protein DprA [bacterium]